MITTIIIVAIVILFVVLRMREKHQLDKLRKSQGDGDNNSVDSSLFNEPNYHSKKAKELSMKLTRAVAKLEANGQRLSELVEDGDDVEGDNNSNENSNNNSGDA